jgi:hypothetical protein
MCDPEIVSKMSLRVVVLLNLRPIYVTFRIAKGKVICQLYYLGKCNGWRKVRLGRRPNWNQHFFYVIHSVAGQCMDYRFSGNPALKSHLRRE